jgi:hypothetical protein
MTQSSRRHGPTTTTPIHSNFNVNFTQRGFTYNCDGQWRWTNDRPTNFFTVANPAAFPFVFLSATATGQEVRSLEVCTNHSQENSINFLCVDFEVR